MKRGSNSGFTLLEILVAVTVLAITFTAVFRLYGGTLRSLENSEKYARATVLAEGKMNELLTAEPFPPAPGEGTFDANPQFMWKTEVAEYTSPIGRQGMTQQGMERVITRKIGVSVSWNEESTPRTVTLETLKTTVEENR
ncbi:MAG: prepilin-type N-terminal cleavage/methylation domain-containing protein [Nitrospinae bacterium]|nr:prepilin-type N-terminal cleavage/methylation domain-containing protein [Nitrospinota bacterium]